MKDVACYLCGTSAAVTLFEQKGEDPYLNFVNPALNGVPRFWKACETCGFVYRSPVLDEQELGTLYENYGRDVFRKEAPDAHFDRIDALPPEVSENHPKALWLSSELEKHWGESKLQNEETAILDVGCGAGLFPYKLKKFVNKAALFGVELNPDYASLAKRRAGMTIRQDNYRAGLFGRRFDLVMSTKVLEHVADPRFFIAELAKDLAADGVLFLEVPDILDVAELPAEHDRFYAPHLYYFTTKTLAILLAEAGLEVLRARSVTMGRERSYLQLLAVPTNRKIELAKPYDSAAELLRKRRLKHTN